MHFTPFCAALPLSDLDLQCFYVAPHRLRVSSALELKSGLLKERQRDCLTLIYIELNVIFTNGHRCEITYKN